MRWASPLAACVAAVTVLGCVSPSREGLPPDSPFREPAVRAADLLPQGITVGDVTPTSALLWVRTDGPALVQVEYAPPSVWDQASRMATVVSPVARTSRMATSPESDYTVSIPLLRLVPGTTYHYHILVGRPVDGLHHIEAKLAARGEFRTLPDPSTSVPVRFAWSGDLGGQGHCRQGPAGYPIFDVMRRQDLDFFIFLGDTIYSDNACPSPPNEPGADFIASTLPEYRARHRYQRGAESLRRFLETVPVYVAWDDHEVRNNFAGPVDAQMPAGRQALREYWPIASPPDDPHRLYRSVRYGKDLELFILDTRQYRSRNADPDGPAKTMLGQTQLKWLLDGLGDSTASWKVIVSSVPLSIPKGGGTAVPGNDGWAGGPDGTGFERERQVIVDTILQQRLKNVVWLGADVHFVEASAYDPDGDGNPDFHEFIAGPLSAATGRLPEQSRSLRPTTLIHEAGYLNFGLVTVAAESFDVQAVDGEGRVRFSYHLPRR
ncbi:alkaline phosphatase D family protein [Nitrospira moscoviensis]|uniref:Phosphodiesterase/alkaline phosphatase D n=1 Tax=Nitrospira moscoviensis TaxID=42253 RepID=A0A0K2G8U6_NITMO|nr:alkaline phosphatase D family protein [Nitrospira moscoviensis]ALA57360.1 Phosphodiesterase/alkaline phosphatase D [Nitrospira moscoviensis]